MSDERAVPRAIDALRRGWTVRIEGGDGALSLAAVETADAPGGADLLVSARRAAVLRIVNQREAAEDAPVRIAASQWLDASAVADPVRDLASPLKGPFVAQRLDEKSAAGAAMRLARLAGILPALHILEAAPEDVLVSAAAVDDYRADHRVEIVARAALPLADVGSSEIFAFRAGDGSSPIALVFGAAGGGTPLVRLHSECLTGDALGSLKCDCGPQLHLALARLAAEGRGILLYLRQEGRGIGLVNKLRAYALQDQGYDTVEANHRLGFEDDERDYGTGAAMLRALGQERIRLLSNNPAKAAGLTAAGIAVDERLALATPGNPHNLAYLSTKRDRSEHML